MNNYRTQKTVLFILAVLILMISILYLTRTINDNDFFWHLKTGEWIWENKSLPLKDPFAYTTPQIYSSKEIFTLTAYWLSQTIYYLFYLLGGMSGIVLLRFIIAGALIYIMLKRKAGDNILYMGLLLIFLTVLFGMYPLERPQVFSFLFFAILLYLLENQVKAEATRNLNLNLILIPLLMLLWSNMHGGYLLGQITIILYIVVERIKFIHPSLKPIKKEIYTGLLISGGLGIAFSLINPNTYHALTEMISVPAYMTEGINEYASTIKAFKIFYQYSIVLYWFILLLTIIGLGLAINRKEINITELALLSATGFFSFTTVRYVPFFIITALPVAGRLFSEGKLLKLSRIIILTISLSAGVFFASNERFNLKNIASNEWINGFRFPVEASKFIIANDIQGNMYNYYDWGGYLIWKLAPKRKVFIDGRGLAGYVYGQSVLINNALRDKIAEVPAWKSTLIAYNIKNVVTPVLVSSGMPPLTSALLGDRDWIPVFFYQNSMIFVKASPENYHVIKKYSIPKEYIIDNLIDTCNKWIKYNPRRFSFYIAKGDLYLSKSKIKEARETYKKALEIAPFNSVAKERLAFLDSIKTK